MQLIADEKELNETIDFSFKYNWQGTGSWKDADKYIIAVPSKHNKSTANYKPVVFDSVIKWEKKSTE
jgi:hypothetical protein